MTFCGIDMDITFEDLRDLTDEQFFTRYMKPAIANLRDATKDLKGDARVSIDVKPK